MVSKKMEMLQEGKDKSDQKIAFSFGCIAPSTFLYSKIAVFEWNTVITCKLCILL